MLRQRISTSTLRHVSPKFLGLVDLVRSGEINVTAPQLAVTYSRHRLVAFCPPPFHQLGSCFLICGRDNFIGYSGSRLLKRFLLEPLLQLGVAATILALALLGIVEGIFRAGSILGLKRFAQEIQGIAWEIFLDSPPRRTWLSAVKNNWARGLLAMAVLKGYYELDLIDSFLPRRHFPFQSIEEIGKGLEYLAWSFLLPSPTVSLYKQVMTQPVLRPIKSSLKRRPPVFLYSIGGLKALEYLRAPENSKTIYMMGTSAAYAFMWQYKNQLNCMCDSLDSEYWNLNAGLGYARERTDFGENLRKAMLELSMLGFTHRLADKYKFPETAQLDTEIILSKGAKEVSLVKVRFGVLRLLLKISLLLLLFSFACFVAENVPKLFRVEPRDYDMGHNWFQGNWFMAHSPHW